MVLREWIRGCRSATEAEEAKTKLLEVNPLLVMIREDDYAEFDDFAPFVKLWNLVISSIVQSFLFSTLIKQLQHLVVMIPLASVSSAPKTSKGLL